MKRPLEHDGASPCSDLVLRRPSSSPPATQDNMPAHLAPQLGRGAGLRSCSGGSHNMPCSPSLPPRSPAPSGSASLSSGEDTQNTTLTEPGAANIIPEVRAQLRKKKIRIIQPISSTWCRDVLISAATGPDVGLTPAASQGGLQALTGAHGPGSANTCNKSPRKGTNSGDIGDSGAAGTSASGLPLHLLSASGCRRSPLKLCGDDRPRGPAAAAPPLHHAAGGPGAGPARPTDGAVHHMHSAAPDQAAPDGPSEPPAAAAAAAGGPSSLPPQPPPSTPGTSTEVSHHTTNLAAVPGATAPAGAEGVVVLGEVQGQLALLYHWYVGNRNNYLDQTKSLVSGLDQLVQQHRGTSPRHSEVEAVNQAVQTALQIIKTSTDLECSSWQAETQ